MRSLLNQPLLARYVSWRADVIPIGATAISDGGSAVEESFHCSRTKISRLHCARASLHSARNDTFARALVSGLVILIAISLIAATSQKPIPAAQPVPDDKPILVPPWFQHSLIYHNSFEKEQAQPEVNIENIERVNETPQLAPKGLFGQALLSDGKPRFRLKSKAFSPHQPLTISFWWALKEDARIDCAFNLFGLDGGGYIGHFVRGKGDWCALQRPTGVFQVYYFPGIQNANLLYDGDLASHLSLKAGVWHHTAAVIRAASTVEVYTDGQKVTGIQIEGRHFREADNVQLLECGPVGGYVDELIILDRAMTAEAIQRYYDVISRLHQLT